MATTAFASGAIAQTGGAAGAGGSTTGAAGSTMGTTGSLNGTAGTQGVDPLTTGSQTMGTNNSGTSKDMQLMKNSKRSARSKKYHDPAETSAPSGPSTMPSTATAPQNH